MNWHEFVFTQKKPRLYLRHIIFWLAWGAYFFISMNFLPAQANAPAKPGYSLWSFPEFIRLLLTLCIHLIACYAFIYFILPRYLLKARYMLLFAGIILLGVLMVQGTRFIDTVVFPFLKGSTAKVAYYTSVFSGLLSSVKIIAVATAIKLIKHWWLKQKEKEQLEKEKIEAELQLLKAQIHPSFLFNTLNNIYAFALIPSPKAPEMLLRLSDILSYMLYDCNDREVPLEKEIKMLKDYMTLEKLRYGDKLEMNLQVEGDTSTEKIAPLLLLRFIENSFKQCSDRMTAQAWINMEIQIETHTLMMKLMNGKPVEKPITGNDEEDDFEQVQRRLQLLYPGRHELKITEEPEIMMVSLQIWLEQQIPHDQYKFEKSIENPRGELFENAGKPYLTHPL